MRFVFLKLFSFSIFLNYIYIITLNFATATATDAENYSYYHHSKRLFQYFGTSSLLGWCLNFNFKNIIMAPCQFFLRDIKKLQENF